MDSPETQALLGGNAPLAPQPDPGIVPGMVGAGAALAADVPFVGRVSRRYYPPPIDSAPGPYAGKIPYVSEIARNVGNVARDVGELAGTGMSPIAAAAQTYDNAAYNEMIKAQMSGQAPQGYVHDVGVGSGILASGPDDTPLRRAARLASGPASAALLAGASPLNASLRDAGAGLGSTIAANVGYGGIGSAAQAGLENYGNNQPILTGVPTAAIAGGVFGIHGALGDRATPATQPEIPMPPPRNPLQLAAEATGPTDWINQPQPMRMSAPPEPIPLVEMKGLPPNGEEIPLQADAEIGPQAGSDGQRPVDAAPADGTDGQPVAPEQGAEADVLAPPPPPGAEAAPPPQAHPAWLSSNIDSLAAEAKRKGIDNEIENLAAQRLTAGQVAEKLGVDKSIVLAVRAKRGIPSMDTGPEFEAWLNQRSAPPPQGEAPAETKPSPVEPLPLEQKVPETIVVKSDNQALPLEDIGNVEPPPAPPNTRTVVAEGDGEPNGVSIKHAAMDDLRPQHGLPDRKPPQSKTWDESLATVKQQLEDNPNAGHELVAELNHKSRALTQDEDTLLTHHTRTLVNQRAKAAQAVIDARESGDNAARVEAHIREGQLSDQLLEAANVAATTGHHGGAGLNARKMALKEDYSLGRMEVRKRAALGGRKLTPTEQVELEAAHKRISELETRLDEHIAKVEAQKAAKPKPSAPNRGAAYGSKNVLVSREAAEAAKNELRAAMGHLNVGIDPALIAPLAKLGMFHLEAGARSFADWSARMVEDVGENVRPHLNETWDKVKAQLSDSKKDDARLKSYKTRTAKRAAELDAKTAAGDFTAKPKPQPLVMDHEAMRLKANAERAKQSFDEALRQHRLAGRTHLEKAQDTFVKWRRGFILSSPTVLAKLTAAAAQRLVMTPVEEGVGALASRAFPKLAARAPRQGGFNAHAEAKALTEGFTTGMRDAWQVLRTGKSDLDILYGKAGDHQETKSNLWPLRKLDPAVEFIGHLHSALKAPVKRAEFTRSFEKRMAHAIRNGADGTEPLVQTKIAMDAYKDANRAIFMQDNRVVTAYKAGLKILDQPDKTGNVSVAGKLATTAIKSELPVVKIPTNIVGEIWEHAVGSVLGSTKLVKAYRRGIESLPEEQSDVIMRQIKKGSIGLALLGTGLYLKHNLGGYYKGDKKPDIDPGAARVAGVDIPKAALHSPQAETLQMGANVGQLLEKEGLPVSVGETLLGLSEEIPFINETIDFSKLYGYNPGGFIGNTVRSYVVPQGIQWAAQEMDKDANGATVPRKPKGIMQNIEAGLPLLRNKLPEKR